MKFTTILHRCLMLSLSVYACVVAKISTNGSISNATGDRPAAEMKILWESKARYIANWTASDKPEASSKIRTEPRFCSRKRAERSAGDRIEFARTVRKSLAPTILATHRAD